MGVAESSGAHNTDTENNMTIDKIQRLISETEAFIAKQEAAHRVSMTAVHTLSRDVDIIWDACDNVIEEAEANGWAYHLSVAERQYKEANALAARLGALHVRRNAA